MSPAHHGMIWLHMLSCSLRSSLWFVISPLATLSLPMGETGLSSIETWGHLLAFCGTRTYHRLVALLKMPVSRYAIACNGCTGADSRNRMT